MTTKHLTGSYPSGYALAAGYSELTVGKAAYIGGAGVSSTHYATIINRGLIDATASTGLSLTDGGRVANFGSIEGKYNGISLQHGGEVTNGSAAWTTAVISASEFAIAELSGGTPVTVANFATIRGGYGVFLVTPSSSVTNGSAGDTSALIYGIGGGVMEAYTSDTVEELTNFGTIESPTVFGVALGPGGVVTNGSATDVTAMIGGNAFSGLLIGGRYPSSYAALATVTNFGTIEGGHGAVNIPHGGIVTNGSPTDATALIRGGAYGVWTAEVQQYTPSTVTNFGTIAASGGGYSVHLGSRHDRLIAEAGSTFVGMANGDGGTLELSSGTGAITGLGATGTVSGALALTFGHFAAYDLDAGSGWTLVGANSLLASQDLTLASGATMTIVGTGTLSVAGTVTQNGLVTVGNSVHGAAVLSILNTGVWDMGAAIVGGGADGEAITVSGLLIHSDGSEPGQVAISTIDNGTIEAAVGALDLAKSVSGTGILKIDAGAVLEVDGSVGASLSAVFNGTLATLTLESAKRFAATIEGFAVGDAIDLAGIKATSAAIGPNDTLVISKKSKAVVTLQLSGAYAGDTFAITSDGSGGSVVTLVSAGNRALFINAVASLGGGTAQTDSPIDAFRIESARPLVVPPRNWLG